MKKKRCSKCKQLKFKKQFYKNKVKHDGLQNYCKDCHIKSVLKRQRKNPQNFFKERTIKHKQTVKLHIRKYKSFNKCRDCERKYHFSKMQFDHKRGVKEASISDMMTRHLSLKRIQEEIKKCDLVCANCHAYRT